MNTLLIQLTFLGFLSVGLSWDIDYIDDKGEVMRQVYLQQQIKTRGNLKEQFRSIFKNNSKLIDELIKSPKSQPSKTLEGFKAMLSKQTNLYTSVANKNCIRERKFQDKFSTKQHNPAINSCGGDSNYSNGTIQYSIQDDDAYTFGNPTYICIWTVKGYNITDSIYSFNVTDYNLPQNISTLFNAPNVWNHYSNLRNPDDREIHQPHHTVAIAILVVKPFNTSQPEWPKFTRHLYNRSGDYSTSPGYPEAPPHIQTHHFTNSIGIITYPGINSGASSTAQHGYSVFAIYPSDGRQFVVTITSLKLSKMTQVYLTMFTGNLWKVFSLVSNPSDSELIPNRTIHVIAPYTIGATHGAYLTVETRTWRHSDSRGRRNNDSFTIVWKPFP